MNKRQFIQILRSYGQGTATEEERKFIEAYYDLFDMEPGEETWLKKDHKEMKETMLNEVWEKIQQRQEISIKERNWIRPVKVAAAILILLASGIFIYLINNQQNSQRNLPDQVSVQGEKDQIQPGGNKAILTLANGKQIILDSVQNGSLAKQGNTRIIKLSNGQLSYSKQLAVGSRQLTMSCPRKSGHFSISY